MAVSFDLFGRACEESSGSDIITSEKSDEILESSTLLVATPLRHLYVNLITVSIQFIDWSLFSSLSTPTSMQISLEDEPHSIEAWLSTGIFRYGETNSQMISETAESHCRVKATLDSKITINCRSLTDPSITNSESRLTHLPYIAVLRIHGVIRWIHVIADNRQQSFNNKSPISFATAARYEKGRLEKCDLVVKLPGMS